MLEMRGPKLRWSRGHGVRWRDSGLRKQVEPAGLVGCSGGRGNQESRMTCSALSRSVDVVPLTEM